MTRKKKENTDELMLNIDVDKMKKFVEESNKFAEKFLKAMDKFTDEFQAEIQKEQDVGGDPTE